MSKVLIPAKSAAWYHELKVVGYYGEAVLERTIRQHCGQLFPDYFVFPFKRDVISSKTGEKKRPDLAMIRKDLRAWGVIEVELDEHSLSHVLEQTRVFLDGTYNAPLDAEYIQRQIKDHCNRTVALKRITKLLASTPPEVVVIADDQADGWRRQLEDLGVKFCVFQIFKSTRGLFVYRTTGKYPLVSVQEAHCRRHSQFSNMLEVIDPFDFGQLDADDAIEVEFESYLTRWSVIRDDGVAYLKFIGKSNLLSADASYVIFADNQGRLHFRVN